MLDQIAGETAGLGSATGGLNVKADEFSVVAFEASRRGPGAGDAAASKRPIVATSSAAQSDWIGVGVDARLFMNCGELNSGDAGTRSRELGVSS